MLTRTASRTISSSTIPSLERAISHARVSCNPYSDMHTSVHTRARPKAITRPSGSHMAYRNDVRSPGALTSPAPSIMSAFLHVPSAPNLKPPPASSVEMRRGNGNLGAYPFPRGGRSKTTAASPRTNEAESLTQTQSKSLPSKKSTRLQLRFAPYALKPSHYEPAFNSAHAMVLPIRVLDDGIIPSLANMEISEVENTMDLEEQEVATVLKSCKGRVHTPFNRPQRSNSWLGQ